MPSHSWLKKEKKKNTACLLYSWILRLFAVIPTSHIFYCSLLVSIFCLLALICLLIFANDLSACNRFSRNAHPLATTTTPPPSLQPQEIWNRSTITLAEPNKAVKKLIWCVLQDAVLHLEMKNVNQSVSCSPYCKYSALFWFFDITITEYFNEAGQMVLTSISLL